MLNFSMKLFGYLSYLGLKPTIFVSADKSLMIGHFSDMFQVWDWEFILKGSSSVKSDSFWIGVFAHNYGDICFFQMLQGYKKPRTYFVWYCSLAVSGSYEQYKLDPQIYVTSGWL